MALERRTMDAQYPCAICFTEQKERAKRFIAQNSKATLSSLIREAVDFYLDHHFTESDQNNTIGEVVSSEEQS